MSVIKARKRPVVIEAIKWDGTSASALEIAVWMGKTVSGNAEEMVVVETLEGTLKATPGDYVIKGVNGEFYPCKPDIFEKTYEIVTE